MRILVIGDATCMKETINKFTTKHSYIHHTDYVFNHNILSDVDLIIDFLIADYPENLNIYQNTKHGFIFLNTIKTTLAKLFFQAKLNNIDLQDRCIGFNGWPTFLNREIIEATTLTKSNHSSLFNLFKELETSFLFVEDRVGMVMPRIICMIINEAFYTLQEGTASEEDIDIGMKLGTNYPYGPFEWASQIGIKAIYELLESLYHDTKDERYKIAVLLRERYLLHRY